MSSILIFCLSSPICHCTYSVPPPPYSRSRESLFPPTSGFVESGAFGPLARDLFVWITLHRFWFRLPIPLPVFFLSLIIFLPVLKKVGISPSPKINTISKGRALFPFQFHCPASPKTVPSFCTNDPTAPRPTPPAIPHRCDIPLS